jgi:hypothetical protein
VPRAHADGSGRRCATGGSSVQRQQAVAAAEGGGRRALQRWAHDGERREETDVWARFEFKIQKKIKSAPKFVQSKHYHPSLENFE